MSDPLLWGSLLIGLALVLYLLEVFVPGGVLGFVATLSLVAGIIFMFWYDVTTGLVTTVVVLCLAPVALGLALKYLPHTPVGRLLTLEGRVTRGETTPEVERAGGADRLVGARGAAVTELRPVGTCDFDGERVECLAEAGIIERGSTVEVVAVRGREVKVRAVDA